METLVSVVDPVFCSRNAYVTTPPAAGTLPGVAVFVNARVAVRSRVRVRVAVA